MSVGLRFLAAVLLLIQEQFLPILVASARLTGLADGHRMTDIAVRIGLTLGRVSQLRREFEKSWLAFHGEEAEREQMALLQAA